MIHLYDGYNIVIDSRSYNLCYFYGKRDKNGKEMYKVIGYYTTIAGALRSFKEELVRNKLRERTYEWSEAIEAIKTVNKEIEEFIVKNIPDVRIVDENN